jgi:hypothetical protein
MEVPGRGSPVRRIGGQVAFRVTASSGVFEMGLSYFKRFQMEIALSGVSSGGVPAPEGYRFIPWDPALIEAHAEAKYHSFRFEIDAQVFPCLGEAEGCLRLMSEIAAKQGFLPGATWLAEYVGAGANNREYCGTVQGVWDESGMGGIQNLGVTPHHRGRRLGAALMQKALAGFKEAGLPRAFLQVTAQNEDAVRLYERIGFRRTRTTYKSVEVAYS